MLSGCAAAGGFEPPLRVRWFYAVGEALSLPKLTQLSGSLNVERLRRSGRLRVSLTGAVETIGLYSSQ